MNIRFVACIYLFIYLNTKFGHCIKFVLSLIVFLYNNRDLFFHDFKKLLLNINSIYIYIYCIYSCHESF